jgi:hypothetical protein
MMAGSCFAEHIGSKLQQNKFDIVLNPFGIVFHPFPLAASIERMIQAKEYTTDELLHHHHLWTSFDHHGSFSHPDIAISLKQINEALRQGHDQLKKSTWILVTFGTAWAYRLKSNGKIVANCHKYPASEFERIKTDADEIYRTWASSMQQLQVFNPDARIIFTVSPVRHLRDGAHENQLSKATLLLSIEKLNRDFPHTGYFPAYEIMMDDLRDYRFYGEDMIHPNNTAIDYIWEYFCNTYMADHTLIIMKEVDEIIKAAGHRFIHKTTENIVFAEKNLEKIRQICRQNPGLDFSREIKQFEEIIHKA